MDSLLYLYTICNIKHSRMVDILVPKPTQPLLRRERLKLLELLQLQQQDWRKIITQDSQVCILDDQSFRQLMQNLQKKQKQTISNINQSIIRKSTNHDDDQISQKELIQGFSLDSPASNSRLRVITCEMNDFIFNKLGCKGYQIKRRVVKVDEERCIELYPKFKQFQILSLGRLKRMQQKQNDLKTISFEPNIRYRIQYIQNQKGDELYQKIQSLISTKQLIKRSQLRLYIFNPQLFRLARFQRLLSYYFNRQDTKKPASDIQAQFYNLIDKKEFDQYVVQFSPGQLIDRDSNITLKQSDRLIVEIQQAGKWIFPQQPSFSVAKKCSTCNELAQLHLKFRCGVCQKELLFCSRVCHYQSLLSHLCRSGKQTLSMLYGEENIPIEKNTPQQQKPNNQRAKNNQKDNSFEQIYDHLRVNQIIQSPNKTASKSRERSSSEIQQPPSSIPLKQSSNHKTKRQSLDAPHLSKPSLKKYRRGIENLHNTCYMNSCLQLAARTSLSHIVRSHNLKSNTLSFAFANLLKQLQNSSERSPVRRNEVRQFKDVVDTKMVIFRGQEQQDAHEFFMTFIDKTHDELKTTHQQPIAFSRKANQIRLNPYIYQLQARREWFEFISRQYSPLIDEFFGQTMQTTQCPNCHHQSIKFTPFNSIICPLQEVPHVERINIKHQFLHFSERVQRLQAECRGTVQEMLAELKKIKKHEVKVRYLKLFKTGYQSQFYQITGNTPLQKLSLESKDKLVVFESEHASPSVFVLKFMDNDKTITFKRPLFFKELYSSVSSKMLYKAVQSYFKNILKLYLRDESVLKRIEDKMSESIQFFFTLAYDNNPKANRNNKQSLITLSPNDQKLKLWQGNQKMRQICVLIKSSQRASKDQQVHHKFYDFTINKLNRAVTSNIVLGSALVPPVTLEDCLKYEYSKKSVLDDKNQWYCPSCQQKRRAHLSNSLYKMPPNAIISLKRFLKQMDGSIYQKNETRVKIPLQLNLKDLLKNPKTPSAYYLALSRQEKQALKISKQEIDDRQSYCYGLKGFILHSGEINQGHYKAVVMQNGQWIEFNDQYCRVVDIVRMLQGSNQSNIYVMWYGRMTQ